MLLDLMYVTVCLVFCFTFVPFLNGLQRFLTYLKGFKYENIYSCKSTQDTKKLKR
jgi:hypothetical protein